MLTAACKMSCGNSCPCLLKWPLDTQGSKRDPINCEKAWLDFAVRLLSREVVGKGRGQETVWSERCKPQWWDKVVGLPWKNPTSNPKDSKEVLLKKYTALEKRLREEGRFPTELVEEARLWNEGKYRELFLLTSLTSLLGKVTGVHAAVIDACAKVEELKAKVNQSLLDDIKQCLTSTLQATENFEAKSNVPKTMKRPSSHLGKENNPEPPVKQKRTEKSTSPKPVLPSSSETQAPNVVPSSGQSKNILAYLQKLLARRNHQSNDSRPTKRCQQKIQPKPATSSSLKPPSATVEASVAAAPSPCLVTSVQPQTSSDNITLSQEALSHLLQGNFIVLSQPDQISSTEVLSGPFPCNLPTDHIPNSATGPAPMISEVVSTTPISISHEQPQYINKTYDASCIETSPSSDMSYPSLSTDSLVDNPIVSDGTCLNFQHVNISDQLAADSYLTENSNLVPTDFLLAQQENSSDNVNVASSLSDLNYESSSPQLIEFSSQEGITSNTMTSPCPHPQFAALKQSESTGETQTEHEDMKTEHEDNFCTPSVSSTRTSSGRVDSLGSGSGSDSEQSHQISDAGYCSDGSMVDLDKMFSAEEQSQLWEEDGSFLLDRFLDDLEGVSNENDDISGQFGLLS